MIKENQKKIQRDFGAEWRYLPATLNMADETLKRQRFDRRAC
jgi:hypothetical protein